MKIADRVLVVFAVAIVAAGLWKHAESVQASNQALANQIAMMTFAGDVASAHGVDPLALAIADSLTTAMRADGATVDFNELAEVTNAILTLHELGRMVDVRLVAAVISAETGGTWRPDLISPDGAVGLMQVLPSTAAWVAAQYGLAVADSALFDPGYNVLIGGLYLHDLVRRYGEVRGVAAYNAGPRRGASRSAWPAETRRYVSLVMQKAGIVLLD